MEQLSLMRAVEPRSPLIAPEEPDQDSTVVPVPPKSAWFDDQGFDLKFAKVVYKRRF